jgi:hypothetical protein
MSISKLVDSAQAIVKTVKNNMHVRNIAVRPYMSVNGANIRGPTQKPNMYTVTQKEPRNLSLPSGLKSEEPAEHPEPASLTPEI